LDPKGKHIKRTIAITITAIALLFSSIQLEGTDSSEPPDTPKLDFQNLICEIPEMTMDPFWGTKKELIGGGIGGEEITVSFKNQKKEVKNFDLPKWDILYPVVCPYYTQKYWVRHRGVDLISKKSNWVVAVQKGTIIFQGWNGGYGNQIKIDHGNGFITTYSHLSKFEWEVGKEVIPGIKIGEIGSTGHSTGPHLHFEILYKGIKIDPDIYLKK